MGENIEINKRRLAEWWLLLNRWKTPQELLFGGKNKMNYDVIRGAFQVVNSMINLKEIKKIKPKVKV